MALSALEVSRANGQARTHRTGQACQLPVASCHWMKQNRHWPTKKQRQNRHQLRLIQSPLPVSSFFSPPPCSLQASNTSPAYHPPPPPQRERHRQEEGRLPHERRRARQDFFCLCGILLLSIHSPLSLRSSIIFATPLGEELAGLAVSFASHWPGCQIVPSRVNLHQSSFIHK